MCYAIISFKEFGFYCAEHPGDVFAIVRQGNIACEALCCKIVEGYWPINSLSPKFESQHPAIKVDCGPKCIGISIKMFLDKFVVSQMRFIEWMKFKIFFLSKP
jgi:hypothetical protein